jgi:hypothetical protein
VVHGFILQCQYIHRELGNREQGTGNREQGTGNREQGTGNREQNKKLLPITNHQSPITNHQLPITNYQLPITNYQLPKMPNQLMYQQDDFVVLETNQPEQFLTVAELLLKLETTLLQISQEDLPLDLQKFNSISQQAQYLLDTSCNLDLGPGKYLQWYAVRLEK